MAISGTGNQEIELNELIKTNPKEIFKFLGELEAFILKILLSPNLDHALSIQELFKYSLAYDSLKASSKHKLLETLMKANPKSVEIILKPGFTASFYTELSIFAVGWLGEKEFKDTYADLRAKGIKPTSFNRIKRTLERMLEMGLVGRRKMHGVKADYVWFANPELTKDVFDKLKEMVDKN